MKEPGREQAELVWPKAELMYSICRRACQDALERVEEHLAEGRITIALMWLRTARAWEADMIGWASRD